MAANIILVTLDSCRRDSMAECHPYLDFMGRMVYRESRAHGDWTLPSHQALLSGNLPWGGINDVKHLCQLAPWMPTTLKSAGFNTILAGALPWVGPAGNMTRGFQYVNKQEFGSDKLYTPLEASLKFVKAVWRKDKDNFLMLNVGETHWPFSSGAIEKAAPIQELIKDNVSLDVVSSGLASQMHSAQKDALLDVDGMLGEWADSIENANWLITSDHGELFGEVYDGDRKFLHGHGGLPEEMRVFTLFSDPASWMED